PHGAGARVRDARVKAFSSLREAWPRPSRGDARARRNAAVDPRRKRRTGVVVLAIVLRATVAHAQVRDRPAISVERFTPADGRGDFAVVATPDVLPAYYWGASFWTSAMSRPVEFRDATGAIVGTGVRTRWTFDAGGAIGLGTRYQVGLAIPVALQWDD